MDILAKVEEIAAQSSFSEYGYVKIGNVNYYPEIRKICEENSCKGYGASWACPPAVGTIEACKARVRQYEKMLLLSKKYELEDSFDFEGMTDGMLDFKKTVDIFRRT